MIKSIVLLCLCAIVPLVFAVDDPQQQRELITIEAKIKRLEQEIEAQQTKKNVLQQNRQQVLRKINETEASIDTIRQSLEANKRQLQTNQNELQSLKKNTSR